MVMEISDDSPDRALPAGTGGLPSSYRGANPDLVARLLRVGGQGEEPIVHIETHISHVFLTGARAFKLKKAVRLPFLDYSSLAVRRRMVLRELLINRLFAPELYLGLVPIVKENRCGPERAVASFTLGPLLMPQTVVGGSELEALLSDPEALDALLGEWSGDNQVSEWLVVMRRFADKDRFDRLASAGGLRAADVSGLADTLARYHQRAAIRRDLGGSEALARGFADVVATLESLPDSPWSASELTKFSEGIMSRIEQAAPRLDARRRHGRVRRCHGDLHLANVCRFEGHVRAFDAIEFSDRIGVIDIAHDAAFAVMDLIAHHRPQAASHLFNRYLEATNEDSALAFWPLLLALRATIRAMASAGAGSRERAARYRGVAEAAIAIKKRRLWVAIGGLSGSGKSTVSRILAPALHPAPGALWLRSDGIRKRLFGKLPEERLENPDAYAPTAHARTYRRLLSRARFAAQAGWPAILDATWIHAGTRDRLDDIAGQLDIPLLRFWIDAAPQTLRQRVAVRKGDVSDADLKVLEGQLAQWQGVPTGWTALPGEENPQELAERILAAANLADK